MLQTQGIDPKVLQFFDHCLKEKTNALLTAGVSEPVMVREHFLFYTLSDALCFCHLQPHWLQKPGSRAFTAVGLLPAFQDIALLSLYFPNARFIAVFDNDLPGRVLDCKIALWSKSKDARFFFGEGKILCDYQGKQIAVPEREFSLHRFQLRSGLRAGIRTIKPKAGFSSFPIQHRQQMNQYHI